MKTRPCILLLLAACAVMRVCAQNPVAESLARHHNFIRQTVLQTKERLAPHLSASDRAKLDSIDVQILDEWGANAFALRRSDGSRAVIFPAGMAAMIEWTVDAMLIEIFQHRTGFTKAYTEYLHDGMADNALRIQQRRAPKPVYEPYSWSQQPANGFAPVTVTQMMAVPDVGAKRNDFIYYSVQLLLLHEFAHHLCGHVDHPLSYTRIKNEDPGELRLSREQEHEADVWAFTKAKEMHIPIPATGPLWSFIAMASFGDANEELQMTHPSGGRRLLQMIDVMLDDPEVRRLFDREDFWPGFKQGLEALRQEFPEH